MAPKRPTLESRHSYLQKSPNAFVPEPANILPRRRRAYTSPDRLLNPSPSLFLSLTPKRLSLETEPTRAPPTLLDKLLSEGGVDLDAYGITEYRDGFFDALFFKPAEVDRSELLRTAQATLPDDFEKKNPLSIKHFFPSQWSGIRGVFRRVSSTQTGVRLLKTFLAFFIAYVLCLIPTTDQWLGDYSFYMVISVIINHPSRTVGAQIEGAVLTTIGTVAGLGWGALGLLLSTSTPAARNGYGGILALFVALFMAIISVIRASYIRFYQLVLCAGIAATYACLSEVTGKSVEWSKFYAHGIPWMLGQAISLLVNVVFFPDAGARPIASTMHNTFTLILDALDMSRKNLPSLKRKLSGAFVNLEQTYGDFAIEISITRFYPADVKKVIGLLQSVVRALLSFEQNEKLLEAISGEHPSLFSAMVDEKSKKPHKPSSIPGLVDGMTVPTRDLLFNMKKCIIRCDAIIMDLSGYRQYLGPPEHVPTDVMVSLSQLWTSMKAFDEAESNCLLEKITPDKKHASLPEVLEWFVFCRQVREAATTVESLSVKINEMKQCGRQFPRFHLPSYPFVEGLNRTNAQVRHDRGGVTAGSYFTSFGEIAGLVKNMRSRRHAPMSLEDDYFGDEAAKASAADPDLDNPISADKTRFRYRLWKGLRRLQGFEARYAFKMVLLTGTLSIPAWIKSEHRQWWNTYNCWWIVAVAWIMMHPRAGANFQDLFTRSFIAMFGAIWGVLAYVVGHGNPIIMGLFATAYMLPMLYRFAQSSHPRSGLVGCLSFTIVSLTAYNSKGDPPAWLVGINTGLAIVIGVAAAILVNWILWPFVSRRELRKAIATMLFYMSIMYRTVVANYVYYEGDAGPSIKADIARSEQLEGMLREGFVRLRQLLGLTRHEIRLRGKFDARPYAALVDSCERFFQYLVSVRQASLSYEHCRGVEDEDVAGELLSYRRDAVASVLSNLYILSGAIRGGRKVPRYLPSAPAARKRLLEKLDEVRIDITTTTETTKGKTPEAIKLQKKSRAYDYLYHHSLTGCVAQLAELEKYTKEIVGEQGFYEVLKESAYTAEPGTY